MLNNIKKKKRPYVSPSADDLVNSALIGIVDCTKGTTPSCCPGAEPYGAGCSVGNEADTCQAGPLACDCPFGTCITLERGCCISGSAPDLNICYAGGHAS